MDTAILLGLTALHDTVCVDLKAAYGSKKNART